MVMPMADFLIDGQRPPKVELMPALDFRNLDLPVVHEVPFEAWLFEAGWPDTQPAEMMP